MIELKESNPVELAEYTVANGIQAEPAFNWRANYFLRKREGIISKVNSRFKKSNIKFGIEIPSTYKETLELDRRNGNEYWGMVGFSCYAFEGIGVVMPIMSACECPEKFDKILFYALLTLTVIYCFFGNFCYLVIGTDLDTTFIT